MVPKILEVRSKFRTCSNARAQIFAAHAVFGSKAHF